MHRILETLQEKFPDCGASRVGRMRRGETCLPRCGPADFVEVARFLHDDPAMAFDHITDICSADYPDDLERFEVIYHFLSLPHSTRIRLKARVTEDDPVIGSITSIWHGAEFYGA